MTFPAYPNSMRSLPPSAPGGHVSILMRTRDRPVLLARALASVLSQVHQDWHLALVNDGGDPARVDRLVQRHDTDFLGRITVIHHPRSLGMEAASNAALSAADGAGQGSYVAVHDDDDTWHPDFLSRTTTLLGRPDQQDKAAALTHWTVVRERLQHDAVVEDAREPGPFGARTLELGDMLIRNRFPPIALLIRRSVVDAAGPFNAALPVLGDWDYNLRILLLGDIGVLPEPLAFYHQRAVDAAPEYANTVVSGADRHDLAEALYRNSRLRALGHDHPAALSLVQMLGRQSERHHEQAAAQAARILANLDRNGLWGHARHEDLQARLVRVEAMLDEVTDRLRALQETTSAASLSTRLRRLRARLTSRGQR